MLFRRFLAAALLAITLAGCAGSFALPAIDHATALLDEHFVAAPVAADERMVALAGQQRVYLYGNNSFNPVLDCQFSAGNWSYSAASFTAQGTGCVVTFSQTTLTTMFGADGLLTFGPNNQLTNSATLSTKTMTVAPNNMILSFYGTGSVTASGVASFTLNGTGAGNQVYHAFTPTAGSLTLTVTGSVTSAVLASVTHETTPRSQDQVITGASAYYGPRLDYSYGIAQFEVERIASTNLALWSRDLTQAGTWTVSALSSTAKDQTGIDGVANSASSFTAGAANATVVQVVTHVSSTDDYAVWLKRISGTGTINLTLDGATYTPVVLTTSWKRFSITQGSVVNPAFGIQIVTSGDKIAVDQNQLEVLGFPTSDIITGASQVTQAADVVTASLPSRWNKNGGAIAAKFITPSIVQVGASQSIVSIDDGSMNNRHDSYWSSGGLLGYFVAVGGSVISTLYSANVISGVTQRNVVSFGSAGFAISANGAAVQTHAAGALPVPTEIEFAASGGGSVSNVFLERVQVYGTQLSNAQVQALSAGGF